MSLGLVLSGGGVKGAAHIGALKALQEENVKFDYIAGTSSGSIVAILYAAGYNADEIFQLFKKYCKKINYISLRSILKTIYGLVFKRKFILDGLNDGKIIEKIISEACEDKGIYNMNDISFPIAIPSVDLCTGDVLVFTQKLNRNVYTDNVTYYNDIEVGKAVRASCSYPGVFSPCKYKGKHLVDGGVRENVAWKEAKSLGADEVLCIVFEKKFKKCKSDNIIDIVKGSLDLLGRELSNYELNGAEFILKIKTRDFSLLDISKIDECFKIGYEETKKQIKKMKIKQS